MNNAKIYAILSGLIFVFLTAEIVFAAQPSTVAAAGKLTASGGGILNGNYNITFNIYDAQTSGSLLWTEIHDGRTGAPKVSVKSSAWSTLLGNNTALSLPWNQSYFLEMIVEGETLSPRIPFSSVPFILNSTNPAKMNFTDAIAFDSASIVHFRGNLNLSLTANNITGGTIAEARIPTTLTQAYTFTNAVHILNSSTLLNFSVSANNITNATFTRALSIILTPSGTAAIDAFNITDGTNTFVKADIVNRTFRINGGIGADAFNVSTGNTRIFDIDTALGYIRVSGPAGGTADAFNVTRGDGSRIFDIDTAQKRVRITGGGSDAFNITDGQNRIFDIDATTKVVKFSQSVNFTNGLNTSLPQVFVNDVNISQSVPIYWNQSAISTFTSAQSPFIQAGSSTGSVGCTPGAMTNYTVTLGRAFTNPSTYSVTFSLTNTTAAGAAPSLAVYIVIKNDSKSFNFTCNVGGSAANLMFNWMAIGY